MPKLIVCNIISLDGLFCGSNGDVKAMPFEGLRTMRRTSVF